MMRPETSHLRLVAHVGGQDQAPLVRHTHGLGACPLCDPALYAQVGARHKGVAR